MLIKIVVGFIYGKFSTELIVM